MGKYEDKCQKTTEIDINEKSSY